MSYGQITDFETPSDAPEASPPPVAAPAEPSGEPPAAESADAAESEAPPERDEQGRFRGRRHRARSQQATAGDVPRISELTKKWRTEEDAHKATRAELDKLRQELEGYKAPKPAEPPKPTPEPAKPAAERKAPELSDYTSNPDHADPYAAWLRDVTKFDRDTERIEAEQRATADKAKAEADAAQAALIETFKARQAAYYKEHPEAEKAIQDSEVAKAELTPTIHAMLFALDNGMAVAHYFAEHPEVFSEALLLTTGRPASEQSVAALQRWITAKMTAGRSTGAAPSPPKTTTSAPPPPTPVRTRADRAADEPPSDDDGLDAHAKFWHPRNGPRRRRLG